MVLFDFIKEPIPLMPVESGQEDRICRVFRICKYVPLYAPVMLEPLTLRPGNALIVISDHYN